MRTKKWTWFTGIILALYVLNIIFFYKLPYGSTIFKDVPGDHWAMYDIEYMYNKGLMKGRDETVWNFYPSQPMTRAELVALMLKVDGVETDKLPKATQSVYGDVPLTHWSASVLAEAQKRNLIPFKDAAPGKSFLPDQSVTRGELANAVLLSVHVPVEKGNVNFPDVKGTPYEDAINTVVMHKYAQGNQDGTYKPNDTAKREQVASIFAKALREMRPDDKAKGEKK
jgi:hypothetical protein